MKGLPPESATWRKEAGWTDNEELLASLIETIDGWSRIHAVVMGAQPSKLPRKIHIPRPGDEREEPKKAVSIGQLAAFFAGTGSGASRPV